MSAGGLNWLRIHPWGHHQRRLETGFVNLQDDVKVNASGGPLVPWPISLGV